MYVFIVDKEYFLYLDHWHWCLHCKKISLAREIKSLQANRIYKKSDSASGDPSTPRISIALHLRSLQILNHAFVLVRSALPR
jgi:hypothetical protein